MSLQESIANLTILLFRDVESRSKQEYISMLEQSISSLSIEYIKLVSCPIDSDEYIEQLESWIKGEYFISNLENQGAIFSLLFVSSFLFASWLINV